MECFNFNNINSINNDYKMFKISLQAIIGVLHEYYPTEVIKIEPSIANISRVWIRIEKLGSGIYDIDDLNFTPYSIDWIILFEDIKTKSLDSYENKTLKEDTAEEEYIRHHNSLFNEHDYNREKLDIEDKFETSTMIG